MFYKLFEYLSLNENINSQIDLFSFIESQNDEYIKIKNVLTDFDRVREIYRNEFSIFKIWKAIQIGKILYENNKIIDINEYIDDLSINFYLALLIQEDINIINYKYSLEYIQNIFNQLESKKEKKYYNFIVSEIIHILINNYEQIDTTNEYENNNNVEMIIIADLQKKVNANIENNIIFKIDDIIDKNIEEIYSMI